MPLTSYVDESAITRAALLYQHNIPTLFAILDLLTDLLKTKAEVSANRLRQESHQAPGKISSK